MAVLEIIQLRSTPDVAAELCDEVLRSVGGADPELRIRVLRRIDGGAEAFEQLTFARKLVAAATTGKAGSLGILIQGFDAGAQQSLCNAVVAAALAAGFNLPEFKKDATPAKIRSIRVLGLDDKVDLDRPAADGDPRDGRCKRGVGVQRQRHLRLHAECRLQRVGQLHL